MVIGEVQESKSAEYPKGVCVIAWSSWESHSILPTAAISHKIDPSSPVALETYMAVVNAIIGLTAWAGVKRILEVKEGDTLCVSGAAGAVGSLVCQLGKMAGAKVVGICGSADKCEFLKTLGCAAAVNYKTDDIKAKLKEVCPEGFTCYFDNVSLPLLFFSVFSYEATLPSLSCARVLSMPGRSQVGAEITEAALESMKNEGRVAICGMISQYNQASPHPPPARPPVTSSPA